MNSSLYDLKSSVQELGTFNGHQQFQEQDLAEIRYKLYHSSQPGIVRFPAFLTKYQTNHVRNVWAAPSIAKRFSPYEVGANYVGSPNSVAQREGGNATYFNKTWAPTVDEFTKTLAVSLQVFRNRIEGRLPYGELFGDSGKAMSFRMVHSRNHPEWIEEHTDYYDPENPLNSALHDLSRLQVTVIFAEKGPDYTGEGFSFQDNSGKWLNIGDDIPAKPGDLFVWRYVNPHRVGNIVSGNDQLGFLRMLMPPEDIVNINDIRRPSALAIKYAQCSAKIGAISYGLKLKTRTIIKGKLGI